MKYVIEIVFTDIDNNFYTKGQATMRFDVEADDIDTAYHLAQRLQRNFGADQYNVEIE